MSRDLKEAQDFMTYILGIQKKDNNFSALLCDLMVSFKDHDGNVIDRNNSSLKTGLLFEGCIYGVAGNANLAKKFITGFKELVDKSKSIEKLSRPNSTSFCSGVNSSGVIENA